jgi:hypothetical protein
VRARATLARCAVVIVLCHAFALVPNAVAQTTAAAPRKAGPKKERDFTVGAVFSGPLSQGSANAEELGSSGAPSLTLFTTKNEMAPGFGVDAAFGFQLHRKLWVEAGARLMKTGLRTSITDDFEDASDVTIEAPVTRISAEGALLWYFREKGKTAWFVRGSGGVLRDLSGDFTFAESGFIGSGGVGVRYWWRTNSKGAFKRVGLRAEFKALVQSGGASLGGRSTSIGPAGAVHLVFGY